MGDETHVREEIPTGRSTRGDLRQDEAADDGSVGRLDRVEGATFEVVEGSDGVVGIVASEVGLDEVGVGFVVWTVAG